MLFLLLLFLLGLYAGGLIVIFLAFKWEEDYQKSCTKLPPIPPGATVVALFRERLAIAFWPLVALRELLNYGIGYLLYGHLDDKDDT